MRRVARWAILASCAALIPAFAHAQDATIKLPEDITYKAALPGIPQVAVLFGDPTKPGVYVVRVKVPSGLKLMPHWHPDEVRTVVVLSGTFLLARPLSDRGKMTQGGRLKGWGCGKITRPEIAAMPQLSIPWQRLNSASELKNLTATMARMNCATIVGELWSNHA